MIKVLMIEDEAPIRAMARFALSREGIDMLEAEDVSEAQNILQTKMPDLILLDWMLPDRSGLSLLHWLKREKRTADIPVIMVTAKTDEQDKIRGLDSGADDYITKPFSPKELIARLRAVLRRTTGSDVDGQLHAGDLVLDQSRHSVTCENKRVDLGPTEYRLLQFFLSHPERVYSRSQLLDHVWTSGNLVEERTVDVHIRRLRKALSPFGHDNLIQTVRGSGYRFSTGETGV